MLGVDDASIATTLNGNKNSLPIIGAGASLGATRFCVLAIAVHCCNIEIVVIGPSSAWVAHAHHTFHILRSVCETILATLRPRSAFQLGSAPRWQNWFAGPHLALAVASRVGAHALVRVQLVTHIVWRSIN